MLLKTSIFCLVIFTSLSYAGTPAFKPSGVNCAGIDKQIKRVNSQLRSGYSVKEGERLKEKLRNLKSQRYTCKTNGYSVK